MVEATQGVEHTGAMIALLPSDECCDHMHVEDGESPDELHLTIAYLGDAVDIPVDVQKSLIDALEQFAEGQVAPRGTAFAVNVFNPEDPDIDTAIVLGISGDEMPLFHTTIMSQVEFGLGDFPLPEQHRPWIPHVTLMYTDDISVIESLTDRTDREVVFDHIRVAFGGVHWDIPFADADAVTAAGDVFEEHEHPRGKGGKFVKKGVGGVGKAFAPTKAIYGKPADQEIVAKHDSEKQLRWNAADKKFDLEWNSGALIEQLNKTEAYKLVKTAGWGAPKTKAAPQKGLQAPAEVPSPPSVTPTPVPKKSGKIAPTKIAYGKHAHGAVVAEIDGVDGRMVWNADVKKFATQVKQPDGTWKNVAFFNKGQAYEKLKEPLWVSPTAKSEGISSTGPSTAQPPKPLKKLDLTSGQMAGLTDAATNFHLSGMSKGEAVFDVAFVTAKNHNASIADVLATYDKVLGYDVKPGQLGATGMAVHGWLQTTQGKKTADAYVSDFGVSESIIGIKPGDKLAQSTAYKPAWSPGSTIPGTSNPEDVEAGVIAPRTRTDVEMRKVQRDTPPPWTQPEITALNQYSKSYYVEVNGCLRGTFECDPATQRRIKSVRKAMRPLAVEATSYRGVDFRAFGLNHGDIEGVKSFEGKTITDPGFSSTSINVKRKFAKPITMTIHVPEGASAAYIAGVSNYPSEEELLIQAGTKYKVLKVSPPNPPKYVNTHVELEVIV